MNLEEVQTTEIWDLFEKGRNYQRMLNVFSDTDRNYRMYNGNQWEGLKISGIEPIQLNIINQLLDIRLE